MAGGAGAAVNEFLAAQSMATEVLNLGLPDQFVEHGSHSDQLSWTGLNCANILQRIKNRLNKSEELTASTLSLTDPIELARNTT